MGDTLDWGILGALRGRDNWEQKRAEKQQELKYLDTLNDIKEQENLNAQQRQEAMAKYLNTANTLKVLPKGMERIRALDEELRVPIAEKIKQYGGDINKFWRTEGPVVMQNYLDSLLHHPTTVREVTNAQNYAHWLADKEAGRTERMDIDPNTGQPIGTFQDSLMKYNTGDIDRLDYMGAFKPAKTDESIFGKTYGSENRYKSVPVTASDYADTIYRQLISQGLSDRDARQQAMVLGGNYAKHIQGGGTPLRYKSDKWTPTKAWSDENSALISSKYIVDGFNALLDPKNTQIWQPANQDALAQAREMFKNNPTITNFIDSGAFDIQTADVFPDFNLGKKTITYDKQTQKYEPKEQEDGTVKMVPTGAEVQRITEPVEDAFEPFIKMNGKVYMQTRANKLEGKPPMLLTDGAIDRTFAGVSKSPAVLKVIAYLRKALKESGNLSEAGRPEFEEPVQYVSQDGSDVDLTDATQEQIDAAIEAGIIKPKE